MKLTKKLKVVTDRTAEIRNLTAAMSGHKTKSVLLPKHTIQTQLIRTHTGLNDVQLRFLHLLEETFAHMTSIFKIRPEILEDFNVARTEAIQIGIRCRTTLCQFTGSMYSLFHGSTSDWTKKSWLSTGLTLEQGLPSTFIELLELATEAVYERNDLFGYLVRDIFDEISLAVISVLTKYKIKLLPSNLPTEVYASTTANAPEFLAITKYKGKDAHKETLNLIRMVKDMGVTAGGKDIPISK